MVLALLFALAQNIGARTVCDPGPEVQRHARHQDEVFENGIEGDLKAMLAEYTFQAAQHPEDAGFAWLRGRAHLGRGTPKAVALLRDLLERAPEFAPAHATLAEIYGSDAFRDEERERTERTQLLSTCPKSVILRRPGPLPAHSPLFSRQDPPASLVKVEAALRQEEWRAMRIRLFDWYTPAEKGRALAELHEVDWRAWGMLVRLHRREGRAAKADALLAEMEDRLPRLQSRSDPVFALAAQTLLGLYTEAGQTERVRAALDRLRWNDPSGLRSAEVGALESAFAH